MKFCKNCGSPVEEGDIFCGYCGSRLVGEEKSDRYGKNDFVGEGEEDGQINSEEWAANPPRDESQNGGHFEESNFGGVSETEFDFVDERRGTTINYTTSQPDKRKQLMRNQSADRANTYGILSLVFAILGGVLGIVFGILGLCEAAKAKKLCNTGEYDGKPKISNARILSIIGLVVASIWIITLFT